MIQIELMAMAVHRFVKKNRMLIVKAKLRQANVQFVGMDMCQLILESNNVMIIMF